jgi:hypothetical protein
MTSLMLSGDSRANPFSQFLISNDLQQRMVTQAVGAIGVFVAGDDLMDTLPRQCQRVVMDAIVREGGVLDSLLQSEARASLDMKAEVERAQSRSTKLKNGSSGRTRIRVKT